MDLRGAVALVTGGNGGLGQRICHALAKEGVHVAVMYAQSRDQAEGVARELTSSYQINAAAFACDITDGAAVERLIGDVTRRLGRIDILVNDAAYNKSIPFTDLVQRFINYLCAVAAGRVLCCRWPGYRVSRHRR